MNDNKPHNSFDKLTRLALIEFQIAVSKFEKVELARFNCSHCCAPDVLINMCVLSLLKGSHKVPFPPHF